MTTFLYNRLFLASDTIFRVLLATGKTKDADSADIKQLADTLNSNASNEEKTNFLIEYLLAQRSVLLDAAKTLLFVLVIFLIGRRLVKLGLKLTSRWMEKHEVEVSVQNFVMSFAKVAYNMILLFIIAGILGVSATIVAFVGSAGLTIGLALQGSLSNLAGGILILTLKPFKVGDYIIATGAEGTVQSIDVFYTRLSTTDNKIIVIPNGTITNSNITNSTNASKRMLILNFKVSYGSNVQELRTRLLDLLAHTEKISKEDKMEVVVDKLTPFKVQMQLKAWTKTEDYWQVRYSLFETLKEIIEENEAKLSQ